MTFETKTIFLLGLCGALAFILPLSAMILYKIRNKSAWGVSAWIGIATFTFFAIVLEQQLHKVLLPIVEGNKVMYVLYGAFAAGIFEETGRLFAAKIPLRNRLSTKNAVLLGLGHGGAEMMIVLGISMLTYAGIALEINEQGLNAVMLKLTDRDLTKMSAVLAQLESIRSYNVINMLISLYERITAMIFHVCMSVWIVKAADHKIWLYPAAIAAHALLDVPAAMYQIGLLTSFPMVYVIMTVFTAGAVFITILLTIKYPDNVIPDNIIIDKE